MDHSTKAAELFLHGYNCAQAVAVAFCDLIGLEQDYTAKLVSGFGGGFGGLREVCGAVSGMYFVMGHLYGYESPTDDEAKKELYARVRGLAEKFKEETGSVICRELLKNPNPDPNPSPRTAEYYAKRPCTRMVMVAARLIDEFIAENPL